MSGAPRLTIAQGWEQISPEGFYASNAAGWSSTSANSYVVNNVVVNYDSEIYTFLAREGMRGEIESIDIDDGDGVVPWGALTIRTRELAPPVPGAARYSNYICHQRMWSVNAWYRDEPAMCWVARIRRHDGVAGDYTLRIPDSLRPTVRRAVDTPRQPLQRSDKRLEEVPVAQRKNFLFPYTGQEISDAIQRQIDAEQSALDALNAIDVAALDAALPDNDVTDGIEDKKDTLTSKITRLRQEQAPYKKAAQASFDLDVEDIAHFGLADVTAAPTPAPAPDPAPATAAA